MIELHEIDKYTGNIAIEKVLESDNYEYIENIILLQ